MMTLRQLFRRDRGSQFWHAVYDVDWDKPLASVQSSSQDVLAVAELLDYAGLAAKLGTSEGWVRRNARGTYTRDPIPSVRLGKNVRFDWEKVREWVKRRGK